MTETYEFASPAWVEFAREWVDEAVAGEDLDGVDISFCEEFTDPPVHLSPSGTSIGWHLVVNNGAVTVGAGVIDAATKIVADYDTILPLARMVIDPTDSEQATELASLVVKAMTEGKFTPPSGGLPSQSLPALAEMHNALAVRTS